MIQQLPGTASAASFIGAGLAMVACGAPAAAGRAEEDDAAGGAAQAQTETDGLGSALSRCLGHRLDVYPYRGC